MANYFGFEADKNYGYSQYSGYTHYKSHPGANVPFTSAPGEGNSLTIDDVNRKIKNMHPEDIAALADQWANAVAFMLDVKDFVHRRSVELQEDWKSPAAAGEFLKRGPGETLSYLDMWIDAAQQNVTALRHLVNVTRDARDEMEKLVAEYESKLHAAEDVSGWENFSSFMTSTSWSWSESAKEEIAADQKPIHEEYKQKAQILAQKYANQYYDYISTLTSGMGPPVQPMNAVLNNPGSPPAPNPPSLGSAGPPPAAPPALPPATPPAIPPALSVVNPTEPTLNEPPISPANPPTSTPAPAPGLPNQPTLPPGLPGGLPVLPPGVVRPGLGRTLPGLPPGTGQQALGLRPGTTAPTTPALPPNPGQLGRNSFGRGAGQPPGTGLQPPGRTLRRGTGGPNGRTPAMPGRTGERRRGDELTRLPGAPAAGDESFGRPPGSTAPPVLKNPTGNKDRKRPGSAEALNPTASAGSRDAFRPDGTAPPVLNRPTTPAAPTQPPSRRRGEPSQDRHSSPWADYFGTEQARAEAGSGMLEAPATPLTGSRGAGLEGVPRGLRSHAATQGEHQQGTVNPELSKRRTYSEHVPAPIEDDEARIVTDEQAFEVQTPGGGVVTSRRDEQAYEPEIRRVLGGGQ
ncbi:hypothetical protein [Actinoplanes regularis]|uniref:PPE family protein n=1 Tax=Actinoplanes regularis TaxID=52697 RepID=A0A238WLW6_9ACTN|nr:hypothetical protein [Actinoplanes regularis]GIE84739.1 hypothetical protein Are01nite_12190 [Actinoplanes regularis]SNR47576.1 hypothetical protein SAMN06264365_102684 [Actinoplanes regularis]